MVVKVQLSLATSAAKRRVLVYNRSHSVMWEGDLTPEVERLTKGEPKSFWHAHLNAKKEISLDRKAEWREW